MKKGGGLRRRWMTNTVSIICALGLVFATLITAVFAVYYYSKFVSDGKDWMGDTDFTVASAEKIQRDTAALKTQMDQYNELQYLQYEIMENHEKIGEGI